jgi:hypothetical protein
VLPLASASYSVEVHPQISKLRVDVHWSGSTITTTLVDPNGRRIDAATLASDVTHANGDVWETFDVDSPIAGTWSVESYGADGPAGGETAYSVVDQDPLPSADLDSDSIVDTIDNCVGIANPSQPDLDADGLGDACDDDMDGDAVANASDNCVDAANPAQTNTDANNRAANRAGADSFGDACDDDDDGDGYEDDREIALGKDPVGYCDIMRADVNHMLDPLVRGDGVINVLDLQAVAQLFGQGQPGIREDQNGDGALNVLDLQLIAQRFSKTVAMCA